MDKVSFVEHINKIQELLFSKPQFVKDVLDKLHNYFPRDENGFSDIEHYIFDHNFGKPFQDAEYESPEQLWDKLKK